MKLSLISLTVCLLFFSVPIFGETSDSGQAQDTFFFADQEVDFLLNNRDFQLPSVQQRFHILIPHLSLQKREELYSAHEVSGWWGLANLGPGAGSAIQGDWFGAALTFGVTMIGGMTGFFAGYDYSVTGNKVSYVMYVTGYVIETAGLIFGQIRPWYYANEVNGQMRTLLQLPQGEPSTRNRGFDQ